MNHEEDTETGKCICGNEWPCVEWVMAMERHANFQAAIADTSNRIPPYAE